MERLEVKESKKKITVRIVPLDCKHSCILICGFAHNKDAQLIFAELKPRGRATATIEVARAETSRTLKMA